jgi:hypothetical protein
MDDARDDLLFPEAEPAPDAAAPDDAADISSLFAGLLSANDEAPADDEAPDAEGDEADPLAAEADDDDAADDEDDEDEEDDAAAQLRREVEFYRQQQREAQAAAAEAQSQAFWQQDRAAVNGRLYQALQWVEQELGSAYDPNARLMELLPYVLDHYTRDLEAHHARREQAVWQIARQHGTRTYLTHIQEQFGLDAADARRLAKYPPELMDTIAADLAAARRPMRQVLDQTVDQLTRTRRQLGRNRLAQQIAPGSGRGAITSLADVRERIQGTDEELPHLLSLVANSR